jgi:glycosyltransferase involved in cell wall biosynthesis
MLVCPLHAKSISVSDLTIAAMAATSVILMPNIAVIILTLNEAMHLDRAIQSLGPLAKKVIVVDSFSTDETLEIARAHGATILQNKFVNHSRQFQWALDNIEVDCDWIMRLDADEVLQPALVEEITTKLATLSPDIVGVNLKRRHVFMGRWIRRGGRYPLTLLRIWRRGQGRVENRWMDEHIIIWGGDTVTFESDFVDHNLTDLTFFIDKHNEYATREAIDRLNDEFSFFEADEAVSAGGSSGQARVKRVIKQRLYNPLPFGVGPVGYFLWRYLVQLGFLDGREGLIYHFLQGYWYRFLVEAKVLELRRATCHLSNPAEIKATLAKLTKLPLE